MRRVFRPYLRGTKGRVLALKVWEGHPDNLESKVSESVGTSRSVVISIWQLRSVPAARANYRITSIMCSRTGGDAREHKS